MKHRWLVLIVGAAMGVTGCGRSSTEELDVLRAEHIASVEIPGTTSAAVSERRNGRTMGKQVRAELQRTLSIVDHSAEESVMAAAVKIAQEDGWELGYQAPTPRLSVLMSKTAAGHRLEGSVSVMKDEQRLVIDLTNVGPQPQRPT